MDRSIVYPGSIPLDTDLLNTNRNMMIGLGALMQAVLGSATVVDGLAVGPTVPASLAVVVAPGSITQLATLDAAAYGSLAADTGTPLVKMGINLAPTSFTLVAPVVSGQSVAWLIEASFQESDSAPVVLPNYNAAAPTQPYLGPNNAGTAQNTQRSQRVQLQAKPGAAASTGSQVAPAVDAGWVGLAVVTLAYGQSSVTGASIAPLPAAPVLGFKLPALRPGFAQQAVFSNSGSFVVPAGVRAVKLRIVGGGGGGGGTAGGGAAGCGGAGNNAGGTGGTSSFGTFISATGGQGGLSTGSLWSGGAGGTATGGTINAAGSYGSDGGSDITMINGLGGSSVFGGAGRAAKGGLAPANATGPGGGGGGAYGPASAGGAGAPGIVIVEY
jgi:hypothetical protein